MCKQYLLCIALTMVPLSIKSTIVIIILFSNVKEFQARGQELNILYVKIRQKQSIVQLHKAVPCHHGKFQSISNSFPRTFSPEKTNIRGNTLAERNLTSHQETSEENGHFGHRQSSQDQTNVSKPEREQLSNPTARTGTLGPRSQITTTTDSNTSRPAFSCYHTRRRRSQSIYQRLYNILPSTTSLSDDCYVE